MLPEGELGDQKVLAALLGISEMVAGLTDLEEVLGAIVRITPQLVGVDRCAILLFDPQRHEFRTAQMFGPDRERNAIFQRLVLREDDVRNLAHRILEQKLPALVRGASLPPHMADSLGMRTVLIVPVVCRDTVLGIMLLDHTQGPRAARPRSSTSGGRTGAASCARSGPPRCGTTSGASSTSCARSAGCRPRRARSTARSTTPCRGAS